MPYTWHSHKTDPDPTRTTANRPTIKRTCKQESGTARKYRLSATPLADFAIAIKRTRKKESGTARVNIDYLQRCSPTLRSPT
jgi:hypothetical protein